MRPRERIENPKCTDIQDVHLRVLEVLLDIRDLLLESNLYELYKDSRAALRIKP